jgi:hypothetical protein
MEGGLALARPSVDLPARRASLARERWINLLDPARGLLFKPLDEQAPAGLLDAPIQSCLCRDVPSRLLGRAPSGAGHALDVQILDADNVEPPREACGDLLAPVFPSTSLPSLHAGDLPLHFSAAGGAAPRPRELALQTAQPGGLAATEARAEQKLSGGQGHRHRDASVDADDVANTGATNRLRNSSECNVPPTGPVQRHPVGSRHTRYSAGPSKAHPPDLRDPHLTPVPVQPAYVTRADRNHAESFVHAPPPPPWASVRPREEARLSLGEVTQCLLLNHLAALSQPRIVRAGGGELPALLHVARCDPAPWTPPRVLLDCQVPHVPGVRAVPQQDLFLLSGGLQTVFGHTNIISATRNGGFPMRKELLSCGVHGDLWMSR